MALSPMLAAGARQHATAFQIRRDARDALVHVRDARTGECVGCIEAGLYEVVRALIVEEATTPARGGRQEAGR